MCMRDHVHVPESTRAPVNQVYNSYRLSSLDVVLSTTMSNPHALPCMVPQTSKHTRAISINNRRVFTFKVHRLGILADC